MKYYYIAVCDFFILLRSNCFSNYFEAIKFKTFIDICIDKYIIDKFYQNTFIHLNIIGIFFSVDSVYVV